jgi:hypothetical protein
MTKDTMKDAAVAAESLLFDDRFDAIEDGVRGFALGFAGSSRRCWRRSSGTLSRPRYERGKPNEDGELPLVVGVRHGHRKSGLTGTFGRTEISVQRARLMGAGGKTNEWKSASLRAYQRRTRTADALIAGAYLSGTNTRRISASDPACPLAQLPASYCGSYKSTRYRLSDRHIGIDFMRILHLLNHTIRLNGHLHAAVDLACEQSRQGMPFVSPAAAVISMSYCVITVLLQSSSTIAVDRCSCCDQYWCFENMCAPSDPTLSTPI